VILTEVVFPGLKNTELRRTPMKRIVNALGKLNLPESILQHLNMYAIAAGAAGVGVLALAQPVEAKIVYTPAHVVIGIDEKYSIDLNHDGISDLVIGQFCFHSFAVFCNLYGTLREGNGIEGGQHNDLAAALKAGANIGNTRQFSPYDTVFMAHSVNGKFQWGHWHYAEARYLGVEFRISGKKHFGWARLKNSSGQGATLTGYAYETIAGKSIIARQTKEAADPTNDNLSSGASLTSPIPDKSQPASLGMLALGAQGVPLWRRKESALKCAGPLEPAPIKGSDGYYGYYSLQDCCDTCDQIGRNPIKRLSAISALRASPFPATRRL
jgi:hypothetical protein